MRVERKTSHQMLGLLFSQEEQKKLKEENGRHITRLKNEYTANTQLKIQLAAAGKAAAGKPEAARGKLPALRLAGQKDLEGRLAAALAAAEASEARVAAAERKLAAAVKVGRSCEGVAVRTFHIMRFIQQDGTSDSRHCCMLFPGYLRRYRDLNVDCNRGILSACRASLRVFLQLPTWFGCDASLGCY
jgi:hypothetical protein